METRGKTGKRLLGSLYTGSNPVLTTKSESN